MRLSCKLSNTAFAYLDSEGHDTSEFLFELPWNEAQLCDPGQSLPAREMELFFSQLLLWLKNRTEGTFSAEETIKNIGHASIRYRAWGILDSVMRMMPDVQELWLRPSKLLSHFIEPEPFVFDIEREKNQIRFRIQNDLTEYPLSCQVLLASLEVLPLYMGASHAQTQWKDQQFIYEWNLQSKPLRPNSGETQAAKAAESSPGQLPGQVTPHLSQVEKVRFPLSTTGEEMVQLQQQVAMFAPMDPEVALSNEEALFHSLILSPEAFREMVAVVEKPLKPHRKKVKELPPGPKQLSLHEEVWVENYTVGDTSEVDLATLQQNLNRILDFFVRASQLVTLMAQSDPDRAKIWMRRLQWDKVREEFPGLFDESVQLIKTLKLQKELESCQK